MSAVVQAALVVWDKQKPNEANDASLMHQNNATPGCSVGSSCIQAELTLYALPKQPACVAHWQQSHLLVEQAWQLLLGLGTHQAGWG